MIIPAPYVSLGGLVVTVGTVDITVGSGGAGFGYGFALGSKANDDLISVNGAAYPIEQLRTAGGNNSFLVAFDSGDMAQAVLDYLDTNYTSLQDATPTWSILVSQLSVSGSNIIAISVSSSNLWDAGDVGNTYTMGWA